MTQAYNLSQLANKVNTSGQLNPSNGLSSQVPVVSGGTGQASLTANNVILGNGTSAVQFVAPGSTGNALVSNGTTWVSAIPTSDGSFIGYQIFTASGTYTKATNTPNFIIVEVVGGGGSGNQANLAGNTGGTSSFGAFVSATGGSGGLAQTSSPTQATGGTGSGGNLNVTGSSGSALVPTQSNYRLVGGVSFLGPIGGGSAGTSGTGGGKQQYSCNGGGGGGYARLRILASSLGTTETVTVGAGGTAPSGGVAGTAGIVIVYEYK